MRMKTTKMITITSQILITDKHLTMYCIKGHCEDQCDMCKSDFDNGVDHWADCEDPLNCNCAELIPCQTCQGYGFESTSDGRNEDCSNPHCEYGFMHISHLQTQ